MTRTDKTSGQPLVRVSGLSMDFGGLRAIDSLDIDIFSGEILALIGPNGAGKTTFFNCVTGMYKPSGGSITIMFQGRKNMDITGLKPNAVTKAGIARTFQNIRLFPGMTVLENVMIGRHCRTVSGIAGAVLRTSFTSGEEREIVDDSCKILQRVGLDQYINETAGNLPYGAQRRLEIARALATEPFLLLLDEPAAGMNPQETAELDSLIRSIRDKERIAVLLIEHDMKLVMKVSDRITAMDYGKKIAEGSPDEIRENPNVIRAYLGENFVA